MEREDVYSLKLTMAINATIEKEEDRLIQELRIFIKPHNLTLIALAKLYQIDLLYVFDDEGKATNCQGEAVANQFVMDVGSGIGRIMEHNGGLTRETVETSKELIQTEYLHALRCFITVIENTLSKYQWVLAHDGASLEDYGVPDTFWKNFDGEGLLKQIDLLHAFHDRMDEGLNPHDVMGDFLNDDDAEDSTEVVSHLQEYITHQIIGEHDFIHQNSPFPEEEEPEEEEPEEEEPEEEEPEEEEPEEEEPEEEEIVVEKHVHDENCMHTHNEKSEEEAIEINNLENNLEESVIHKSPPCIDTALPNRTEGVIDWNWMFAAVEASEDRTIESIGDKILALKNKGVIKTKQDFLDSMLFLFYATQKIDKETTQKLASMFSELR